LKRVEGVLMLPAKIVQVPAPLFSSVIASSPVATMALAGAAVGALGGGLGGLTLGKLVGASLAMKGAALGAAILGVRGYASGRELKTWLKEQT
jgi:hypothetical protein